MTAKKRKYEKIDWSDSDESEPEENSSNSTKISDRRCPFCIQLFKSSLDLVKHEKNCTIANTCNAKRVTCKDGSKKFICPICCSTYKYLNLFKLHEQKHKPPGGFCCKYCNFICCNDVKLERHKEEAHKEFLCRLCKVTFETKESYVDHIKQQHEGRDKEYKMCEECGRQFRYSEHLNYHTKTNCQTIFPFKCDECGKSFRSKGILKTHSLIHSGEKKFKCTFCPMSFICKAQVVVHERKHTGEKPYKCDICAKAFAHRESLVTHSSTHTGMKPYLCECCDARFSCVSSILAHRRTRPDTCGLPQYCTKLAKACPRPSVRSKSSAEVINVRPGRVIKSCEKEKLIEKRKIEKKSKTVRFKKDKNVINQMNTNSNYSNINNSSKNNNEIKSQDLVEKSVRATKSSEKEKLIEKCKIEKMLKTTKTTRSKRDKNISSSKLNFLTIQDFDNIKINNEIKSEFLVEKNEISIFTRKRRKNIKIINYAENNKKDILNNFQTVEIKDKCILENKNTFVEKFPVLVNEEQPEMKNPDVEIKIEVETNSIQDTKNNLISELVMGDEVKTETNFISKNLENRNIETGKSIKTEYIQSETSSSSKDSDSNDRFLDNLSLKDMSDCEDNTINESTEKTIVYKNTDYKLKELKLNHKRKDISNINNKDIFECIECIHKQSFRQKISYEKHLRNRHKKTENEIVEILKIKNHKPSSYSCKICGKSFTYPKPLNQHIQMHGIDGNLIIQCKTCTKYFATKEDLLVHAEKYHKNKITCLICDKMYRDTSALQSHKRYAHTERDTNNVQPKKKYTFICNKCGKVLSSKNSLVSHELSKCGTEYLYKCRECGKALSSPAVLKTHIMIHSGELPFVCPFCSKGFRTKAPMVVHQRMHTGEKPFQCTYCEKSFAYRENLFIHLSTHTGIKRYMCTTCSDRFSCISGLKNHWRTHADTCGADPNRTTKAIGEFVGYRKGQLEHKKKT